MNQAELERGFDDEDEESDFDSEAEEEKRHAEEERKKAEKARLEFLDTICVFVAFIIILGAAAGGEQFLQISSKWDLHFVFKDASTINDF